MPARSPVRHQRPSPRPARGRNRSYSRSSSRSSFSSYTSRSTFSSRSRDSRRYRSRSYSRSPSPITNRLRIRSRSPPLPKRLPGNPTTEKSLVVANLSKNVTKEHLQEIFSLIGTVGNIILPFETPGVKSKRCLTALIEFESRDEAEKVLKRMEGVIIDSLKVQARFMTVEDEKGFVKVIHSPKRRSRSRSRSPPVRRNYYHRRHGNSPRSHYQAGRKRFPSPRRSRSPRRR